MKKLLIAAVTVSVLSAPVWSADVEGFHKTWAEAQAAAKAAKKPIYLHFTTTWCRWCRVIEEKIYANPEGKAALKAFVPASLDCTQRDKSGKELEAARANIKLMKKFGVSGYPSLVMVTADGVVLNTFSGYKPMAAFKPELSKALAVKAEYEEFLAGLAKADASSYEHNAKAMTMYAKVQKWDEAAAAAEKVLKLDPADKKGHAADAAAVVLRVAQAQGDAAKARAALAQVKKHDPKNAKGLFEKSAFAHALATFQASRRLPGAEGKKRLQEAIAVLADLTGAGVTLSDAQNDHHLLGFLHALTGEKDKALAAFKKALAVDPNSRAAAIIRKRIEKLGG